MHAKAQQLLIEALAYVRYVQGAAPFTHSQAENGTELAANLQTFLKGVDDK